MFKRFKGSERVLIAVALLVGMVTVAWAATGQVDALAADSSRSSADLELASLETIKKPAKNPPNCDWQLEAKLRKQLEQNTQKYTAIAERARNEANSNGAISKATGDAAITSAAEFEKLSNQYADLWEKGKCITRAKLAREAGATRVQNAQLLASGGKDSSALRAQQDKLAEARRAYVKEANSNGELSAQDKADIKDKLLPRANALVGQIQGLVSQAVSILSELSSQGGVATVGGCSKQIVDGGGDPGDEMFGIAKGLVSMLEGMVSNAQGLVSDISTLTN